MKIINKAIILLVVSTTLVVLCSAEDIHQAIRDHQVAKVKNLLENRPELINYRDSNGMTPLHTAILRDKKEMIDLLIANNVEAYTTNNTPL